MYYNILYMNNLLKIAENINIEENFQGRFVMGEDLSAYTTFKVGGIATVFAEPENERSLIFVLEYLSKNDLPSFILGGGSNIVFSDDEITCVVISLRKMNSISLSEDRLLLRCQAGTPISKITEFCEENEMSGLENFAGLPGSIGGAAFMNARCYEKSISDVLHSVSYIDVDESGKISVQKYFFDDKDWDYKKSPFQNTDRVIVEVELNVSKGVKSEILEKNSFYISDREKKGHFKYPSAGSVFKNNRSFGKPTGQILDELNFKGLTHGGAQVAPWHGNFIINTGKATAREIQCLTQAIIEIVAEKKGFVLEPEILFINSGICRY